MIEELIKIANRLDDLGLIKESDIIDSILKKISQEDMMNKKDRRQSGLQTFIGDHAGKNLSLGDVPPPTIKMDMADPMKAHIKSKLEKAGKDFLILFDGYKFDGKLASDAIYSMAQEKHLSIDDIDDKKLKSLYNELRTKLKLSLWV